MGKQMELYSPEMLSLQDKLAPPKISMKIVPVSKVSDAFSSSMLAAGASGRLSALRSLRVLKSFVMPLHSFLLLLLLPLQLGKRSISTEKLKEEECEISSLHKRGPTLRVPAAMITRRNHLRISDLILSTNRDGATRRALAIKRVEEDNDGSAVREFAFFSTSRGETLFTRSWTPVSVRVREKRGSKRGVHSL